MASIKAIFTATSKAGNTRKVEAEYVNGKLVAVFSKTPIFGDTVVSKPMAIEGDLNRLASFSIRQPGLLSSSSQYI
jgi:hypothetical protein